VLLGAFSLFAYGFLVSLLLAIATGVIGRAKGGSFFIWALIGLVLPGIGLIAAILHRSDRDEPERRCPRCGAVHKLYVQVCRRCGEDLYLPDPSEVRHPRAVREGRQRVVP
jgi:hypothetical protein